MAGDDKYPEDNGFTIDPWAKLEFENTSYIVENNIGIVMDNKHLTQTDGTKVIANYILWDSSKMPKVKCKSCYIIHLCRILQYN